jgi:hypothetical protein
MVTAPVLHRTWGRGVPDKSHLLQGQKGSFASRVASNCGIRGRLRIQNLERPLREVAHGAALLTNGIIEGCAIPPIRPREGEWMGHGAHVVGPAPVHFGGNSLMASQASPDGISSKSFPSEQNETRTLCLQSMK